MGEPTGQQRRRDGRGAQLRLRRRQRVAIHDGHVYVNDVLLDEPYLDQLTTDTKSPVTLTADEYYVMGDNRPSSLDSRTFGPIKFDQFVGKAFLTFWPPKSIHVLK